MIKKGISGGLIKIVSFLDNNDRKALANNTMIRTSSNIREAAKIGLQSLYANADEILEKYKDFDLIKEMKSRKNANLLWVRARAIDADVVNTNGDYFSEDELTKITDYQGKKMPAYKTFEGVPIYTNHKNDNIEEAKGMVVYAEWDDEEKCVYCVFFIDEDAYPDIARGIRMGYLHDVSMGASVELGICSICGNEATTESQYCVCLKEHKGKQHPSGKKAYEYNYGVKFIELSCVGDGAFELCEIEEIYDQQDILEQAKEVIKNARSLNSSISLAASMHDGFSERKQIETALRQLQSLNNDFIRIAQTAGTLVGGQLIGNNVQQNATVNKILQALGINATNNLNILDLVNLALNFLEVSVLNLFARKDNIDLGHVAKITKAMGDLQGTLQDMVDDGIETGQRQQPMIPAQNGQPQPQAPQTQPAQPQNPQVQQTIYQPQVGSLISPMNQQEFVMPLGGGVGASASKSKFVWASTEEPVETHMPKLNKFGKFAVALNNLREACGIAEQYNKEETTSLSQKVSKVSNKDKNMDDLFKKLAKDARKENTVGLAIDIKLDDQNGNKVILSSESGIRGFHKGHQIKWSPSLSDAQISQMENGDGYRVASDLLKDLSGFVKKASDEQKIDSLIVYNQSLEQDKEYDHPQTGQEILKLHTSNPMETMQTKLDARRTDKVEDDVWESFLENDRENVLVHITSELAKDAKKGLGHMPLEEMLHPDKEYSQIHGKEVMTSVVNSIAKTCLATNKSPESVLAFLIKTSKNPNFGKIMKLAKLGTEARKFDLLMNKFAQADNQISLPGAGMDSGDGSAMGDIASPDMAQDPSQDPSQPMDSTAIKGIADDTPKELTTLDLKKAFEILHENFQSAADKIGNIIGIDSGDKGGDMKDALTDSGDDVSPGDVDSAVTGMSLSGDELGAHPDDLVSSVNSMPSDQLSAGIHSARQPGQSMARSKNRNIKTASTKDLNQNLIGWLADVANHKNISSEAMARAAKFFCANKKSANYLAKAMRVADVRVTDESTHTTTIWATLDDVGADIKDAAFNQKFRDFAVELLSNSGYEVDPTTFALTEINVSEDGMVCGKVMTTATKSFTPETDHMDSGPYHDEDRDMVNQPNSDMYGTNMPGTTTQPEIILSESAKSAKRLARMQNVIRIAQGLGLPGAPAQSSPIGGADAGGAPGMAGGGADMGMPGGNEGLSSLTGSDNPINDASEPGTKSPWGTICPQCGSKDVDVANGEGNCNSCNAQLSYKFTVEAKPPENANSNESEATPPPAPDMGTPPEMGAPEPGAGTMGAGVTPPPAAGQAPPMPAMASRLRVMTKVAYKTTADVYANALQDGFNKFAASKLPVGMCCPACGSRTASKDDKHTYCYDCGTLAVSEIKKVPGQAGVLEANIVWI